LLPVVIVVLDAEAFPVRATAGLSKRVDAILADLNATRDRHLATRQAQ
jgi:hypothetical protein